MKKIFFLLYLIGCFYLALPAPQIHPKVVGYRSQEPGDTGQVANVIAAYYTNQSRQEIISQTSRQFKAIILWGKIKIPLPTYTLIHPPQYAKTVIRQTHKSWHFVELVHWQRESLFISFWEPELRNVSLHLKGKNYLLANGQKWQRKVTFYYQKSNIFWRELIWTLEIISLVILYQLFNNISRQMSARKFQNRLKKLLF